MQRVILHCDMNNFYASVECMLNPELKNKPVAVCGSVEERHGIVLAKNYAAKAFGVSTGEAIWQLTPNTFYSYLTILSVNNRLFLHQYTIRSYKQKAHAKNISCSPNILCMYLHLCFY